MPRSSPLNAKDDVRDATLSDWIFVKAVDDFLRHAVGEYSLSGSALMLAKGSTPPIRRRYRLLWASSGIVVPAGLNACANMLRCVTARDIGDIALNSARSTFSAHPAGVPIGFGTSVNRFARMAAPLLP